MRALLIALLIAACSNPAPAVEKGRRVISIGTDALATATSIASRDHATMHVLDADRDVAIVELDAEELAPLSAQMHETFHRCGGFVMHDSLADAEASLHARVRDKNPIEYTLDHAPAVNAVLPALDRSRIEATIAELSAMKNRYYRSDSGAAATLWLRDRCRSFTTRPDVTVELFDQGYPQQSVILTIPGTTRAHEVIVIGGHLDSIGRLGLGGDAPGADDDASGIATLTEIARVVLANDYRPARTIKFIAYAAEEVGLRGSMAIVKEFGKRKIDVVGALQLDMTNYQGSDRDIWLMTDYTSAAQNAFLATLIDTYVGATWGLDTCGYACSDHASWNRAGVPVSMPFESRMKESNHAIHSPQDTLERSDNNADHAIKFARLGAAYAIELGKGELGAATQEPLPAPTGPPLAAWQLLALALCALALARLPARIT